MTVSQLGCVKTRGFDRAPAAAGTDDERQHGQRAHSGSLQLPD